MIFQTTQTKQTIFFLFQILIKTWDVTKQAWSIKNYGYVGDISSGAARGWAAPPGGEAALWPLSPPPSGFFSLLIKYNFLVFF
jgi:hypothetical protein